MPDTHTIDKSTAKSVQESLETTLSGLLTQGKAWLLVMSYLTLISVIRAMQWICCPVEPEQRRQ